MVQAPDPAGPLGAQSRHGEGGAPPKVCGRHLGPVEGPAQDVGGVPLPLNGRAHGAQALGVAEAAVKNGLGDPALPRSPRQGRGQKGLGIGGKGGIGPGTQAAHAPQRAPAANPEPVGGAPGLTAGGLQGCQHRAQVLSLGAQQLPLSPGGRHRAEVGGRHDSVRHHRVFPGVEPAAPLNGDLPGPRAGDLGPHRAEKALEVHDFRLTLGMGRASRRPWSRGP